MLFIGASVLCECGTIISIDFCNPLIVPKCPLCKKSISTQTWEDLLKTLDTLGKSEQSRKGP